MYQYYNPNPRRSNVGDCTIRAIAKATGQSWEDVYAGLSAYGYMMADMPSANSVWGAYLRAKGFTRHIVDDHGRNIYTVEDFCAEHPAGIYVLGLSGHVVCVVDSVLYDSWDSGNEIPICYWTRRTQ